MGSKGRLPPSHVRLPPPGPALMHHPEHFGPGLHTLPGPMHFDVLPPEVLEQKLAAQHFEMQRLASENQRLAMTHSALRQELAGAQQELQRLQGHINAIKTDKEQQIKAAVEKISKMENDLQDAEHVNQELKQAQDEAQALVTSRKELMTKVQRLTEDLQKSHADSHQIPYLVTELESLRQELQHYRGTYEYERKVRNDHLESLQLMEKNYVSMSREMERLRAELANTEGRSGGAHSGTTGYKENDAFGRQTIGKNLYEDSYGVSKGREPAGGGTAHLGGMPGPTSAGLGYKAGHGPSYDMRRGEDDYSAARGAGYGTARGPSYDTQKGHPLYDARDPGYDTARGHPGFDAHSGGAGYDNASLFRGPGGAQITVSPGNAAPSGAPNRAGGAGYEASPRGANTGRR
ncbi:hypothetical protein H6P81_008659 [Aristolochia fimbriata]|uniref:Protein FLX-like 2 n=1 Tax=Aristolochia fimbriata TaxID=158543 RepID=A0AAV7EIY6_ARIFI|nr:hypothetical protein H6P81_008659 [Aristolochia fimbriata]